MTSFRRRLRLWAAAWLVFQAASLAAFVPLDCCAAHQAAGSDKAPGCHEAPPAPVVVECPMLAADGAMCPMHRGHHAGPTTTPDDECSMRGMCGGPMAAMSALLANQGVLADRLALLPEAGAGSAAVPALENLITRLQSPDPPPPRA